MNILIDTNIIIPLEDTNKELPLSFAEMRKRVSELQYCLYLHPMQILDIKRDKDEERKKIVLSRLNQYSQIENPPILTEEERNNWGLKQNNENDEVDNNILFALYRGAVHLLVTNDEEIHRKSQKFGLQDKVYRLPQFLSFLQSCYRASKSFNFTGIEECFLYQIDKNQSFFDSLRHAYEKFDDWYQKSAENKRRCWCIKDDKGKVIAICIYKKEKDEILTDGGNVVDGEILKLCTFKVDPKVRGKKLGERLLYIAFDFCIKNKIDWIYLHMHGEEQKTLIGLCKDYGFSFLGKYMQDDVYIKPMKFKNDMADVWESFVRYYPYYKQTESIGKFIVPIQPKFHEDLFPDFSNLKGSLFEKDQSLYSSQGNTIKKHIYAILKLNLSKKEILYCFTEAGIENLFNVWE